MPTQQALEGSYPHNKLWNVNVMSTQQALNGSCPHNKLLKVHVHTTRFYRSMSTEQALKGSFPQHKLSSVCVMSTQQSLNGYVYTTTLNGSHIAYAETPSKSLCLHTKKWKAHVYTTSLQTLLRILDMNLSCLHNNLSKGSCSHKNLWKVYVYTISFERVVFTQRAFEKSMSTQQALNGSY